MIGGPGLLVGVAGSLGLAAVWRRRGWGDAASPQVARKLQRSPVPTVGGLAILCGWGAELAAFAWRADADLAARLAEFAPRLPGYGRDVDPGRALLAGLAALLAAFALGWIDDLRGRGLSPASKALGQLLAGSLLALALWFPGASAQAPELWQALGWTAGYALAGFVACNALNTFDNADGAAGGVTAAGLAAAGSPLYGAVLGFSLVNLFARRPRSQSRAPRGDACAYLGDAGSHLLGMAALLVPGALPLLWLPLCDLARVALLRLRRGLPPWRGDRRHLAQRLERRGYPPAVVTLLLVAIAAPALLLAPAAGLTASGGLFLVAVWHTRGVAEERPLAAARS